MTVYDDLVDKGTITKKQSRKIRRFYRRFLRGNKIGKVYTVKCPDDIYARLMEEA